jgi:hypothetical protein
MFFSPVMLPTKNISCVKTDTHGVASPATLIFSLTSKNIGAEHWSREIFVVFSALGLNAPTSVTIGGITATVDSPASGGTAFVAHAHVPTGTTADIVITYGATRDYLAATIYRVTNRPVIGATYTDRDNANDTATSIATTLDVSRKGFALITSHHNNANLVTVTGDSTEDYDYTTGTGITKGFSSTGILSAATTINTTHSWSGTPICSIQSWAYA